jgi:phosphotransferase system  glucose/maltose/N-acetylglucosamine-specific IIC component
MEIILFYFGLAIVIGVAASYRGRSGFGWFLLSMVISPILTGLLLFVMPRQNALDDIATLALVEATPEGSLSRQLFVAREAQRVKAARSSRTFVIGISIWVAVILILFLGLVAYHMPHPA